MLPATPSFERAALNRITFGARDLDAAYVRQIGWAQWVEEQLYPPTGDDPAVAEHIGNRRMRIAYAYQGPAGDSPGWPAVDERRHFNYLHADVPALWEMVSKTEITIAPNERRRIQEELNAATWIRNTHSIYQLREFMADFWNNHFNVGRQADIYGAAALASYDNTVIRPRVFGNFRDLLEAVATSPSMLRYLNNAESTAAHPNENYARELLELHTLGAEAYLGLSSSAPPTVGVAGFAVTNGFSDEDVIQASRAFSGWTLEQGQQGPNGALPFTGRFIHNPLQHHDGAATFMGVDFSRFTVPMQQGRAILDIVANHPATADFVCAKICRRIFGDSPPAAVIDRTRKAWLANREAPDQIAQVLKAILLEGEEIGAPPSKLRRPYERLIALLRTTDTIVNAYVESFDAVASLGDGIFAWPTPEGRPDVDAHWMSTSANIETWDLMLHLLSHPSFQTSLAMQTPAEVTGSATLIADYWVDRLVGYALRPEGMSALAKDILGPIGVVAAYESGGITNIESSLRRLVALIGASPEFALR